MESSLKKVKSKVCCCVPGCKSTTQDSTISFHVMPKENVSYVTVLNMFGQEETVERSSLWKKVLNLDKKRSPNVRVCSRHFKDEDYLQKKSNVTKYNILKSKAVPSLNLPVRSPTTEAQMKRKKRYLARSKTPLAAVAAKPRSTTAMNNELRMHEALKPLAWLEGTWRTVKPGSGVFPTIKPFEYHEEINFSSIGQPMLNYAAQSWNPQNMRPMHREVGFLKIVPNTNEVALMASHNFGLCTVEEGRVDDNRDVVLESTSVTRKSGPFKAPAVLQIKREFKLLDGMLHQTFYMATETTPNLTKHLVAVYKKVAN